VKALSVYHTDYHLLDAHSPKAPGGTGESFDWELARLHPRTPPVILSGGLTPDNVADAIAAAEPFAVDTASGTEAEPGRKDPAKLTAFFGAVEAAGHAVGVGEAAGGARGGASA
jgi:phosphoribosylanthranilate isomerase